MASESTFDVVSKVDKQEVANALNQAQKEIAQRYDFKGVGAEVDFSGEKILMKANSEERVLAVLDVLQSRIALDPFNAIATAIFLTAVLHTFFAGWFRAARSAARSASRSAWAGSPRTTATAPARLAIGSAPTTPAQPRHPRH